MGEDDEVAGNAVPGDWKVANALLEPIAVLNRSGKIVAVNAGWKRSAADAGIDSSLVGVGMAYLDACRNGVGVALPCAASIESSLEAILTGRLERFTCEYSWHEKGRKRWFLMTAVRPQEGGEGSVIAHQEISELRGARTTAYHSRSLFSDILEETMDAIFLCDTSDRLILANSAMAKWLGKEVREILGKKVSKAVSPEIGRMLLEQNDEIIAAGKSRTFEITAATAHGPRTFLVTKGLHRSSKGRLKGIFGIARDISGVKAMEREIIDTSDKEKQRLGQELHENLCQYLVGISLLGNVLYEELLRLQLKQAQDARQITSLVKEAITEVRALVKGLSTMSLEQEEGLIAALQDLAEQARIIGKIRCTLRVPRTANFIDPAAAVHLFRIAQEAVHNAIKHAGAKRLQITLSNTRRAVVLKVQDDGVGFTGSPPLVTDTSSGLGLHIMNYRSRAIGAELEIRKLPEQGTAVICSMPKVR